MEDIFKEISGKEWKNDLYILFNLVKKHFLRLVVAILAGIGLSAINGAIAWLVTPAFNELLVEKIRTYLILLPIGAFLLFVFRGFFAFTNSFLMSSIGRKTVRMLRQAFYEKVLRLPMSTFSQRSSSSLLSRALNDIASVQKSIASTSRNFFVHSLTAIALAGVALYRKWDLALLSFIIIPLIVIIIGKLGKRLKKQSKKGRKLISRVTKIIHESLLGIRIVKSFTMENEMKKRSERAVGEHYRNVMRQVRLNEFTSLSVEIIAGAGVAIVLWYSFYLIIQGQLSVGEFLSLIVAITMMYDPLKKLSKVYNEFQRMRTAFHRLREIFALEDEKGGDIEKSQVEGEIILRNVFFKYPGLKVNVLQDINLHIRPGENIAIVGYSGAGKSTLIDIILGFWRSYEGNILLDGIDIKDYDLKNLRSHIGVVSQDIVLFDDTVKNNILFGKPEAGEEEIKEAARVANAHDFIMEMPQGYDTYIGERGIKLSGGQKQRVSLARAVIKNPKILILDEATSSLDTDSEIKIQQALEKIMPGRTSIIIAHRLSTIKKADRIIVMDRGRIIQEGRHDELSSKEGVYQELSNMQFGLVES
jgi:subfamily B ATP-binding cassette protein MsbA